MSNRTSGDGHHDEPNEKEMEHMMEDFALLDEYLANKLSAGARERFEERLRTDMAFQQLAMPFIDGVNAWRNPLRMPIDERDAAENGPTHQELAASDAAKEIEPMLERFADKVGIRRDWFKPEAAEEMDALFQRRMRVRLVADDEALPKVSRPEHEEQDDPKLLNFPKWRRMLIGGGLVAAGIVGTLADLKIQAAVDQKHAVAQTRIEDLRLHITPANHSAFQTKSGTPQPFQTADGGIHGTLLDGSLDLSYLGSAQDSAVFATLSAPGQLDVDIGKTSRGMVISTPSAQIELLEPGQYTITEQNDSVGFVQVVKGLARVDDRTHTVHGVQTARSGEIIKTRRGQMPTRNMR